jgi:hypothetical protein
MLSRETENSLFNSGVSDNEDFSYSLKKMKGNDNPASEKIQVNLSSTKKRSTKNILVFE